jgi:tellurite resistance protein TerC
MDIVTAAVELPWLGMPVWIWIGFVGVVIALLAFDLGVLHGKPHEITVRESITLSSIFIGLGWLFAAVVGVVYFNAAPETLRDPGLVSLTAPAARAWQAAQLYLTGLLVEQSLSIDNIFVISLVFSYFAVPRRYQHRVLFWGILGVIVMRGLMIAGGAALLAHFHWVLYVFGAFLLFTGLKMLFLVGEEPDIANNVVLKFLKKRMRVTDRLHDEHFFVMVPDSKTGKLVRHATPLFLALAVIEFIDLVFAVDSVPAVFAITQEPFIVYTSNIFAILGLRSLYFALAAMVHRFHYLKYALALVLVFIGAKIFLSGWVGKFPPELSLGITLALLAGGILFSLWRTKSNKDRLPHEEAKQIGR